MEKNKNKKKRRIIILSILGAAILIVAVLAILGSRKELTINTTRAAQETVKITVMATGYIQPVEEVEVGTQVSGVIEKIYVDYNSHVTQGQLLAELDTSTLQEKLNQANASLTSAQSDLLYAEQSYSRVKKLYDAKAATQVSLENAVNQLNQAQTALENAKANANQAEVNLSYAYIYSPIDGVVLDRSVNKGQTVAASFNTPTLFTIAEDLTKMQVEVDVDEADIGQIKVGQRATFTVDAYSGQYFEGTVSQVRLQPTVTSNVVTYTVIVEAPNPEEKLYPGMTANITIEVQSETGVTVPMEAVNFKVTQDVAKALNLDVPVTAATRTPMRGNGNGHSYGNTNTHTVWVVTGHNKVEQRKLTTGIDDGINIIVKSGIAEGEEVALSASMNKAADNRKAARNPLMPSRPRR